MLPVEARRAMTFSLARKRSPPILHSVRAELDREGRPPLGEIVKLKNAGLLNALHGLAIGGGGLDWVDGLEAGAYSRAWRKLDRPAARLSLRQQPVHRLGD
jgi:hypothetical protein